MKRRLIRIAIILLFFPPLLAAVGGWLAGPSFLHPIRRELTPDLVREADADFASIHAHREDFVVAAPDAVRLRGWIVRPANPNGSWVLVFHGVADNRVGGLGQAHMLLRAGYSVVMMDARAHGASEGAVASYGWLERRDTSTIIDQLIAEEITRYTAEQIRLGKWTSIKVENVADIKGREYFALHPVFRGQPLHIFALGESMGAGIALQSAGADPRIEAVVAEAAFASLREASYDYAGLQKSPLLGKTLFAPGAWTMIYRAGTASGYPVSEISPQKAVAARNFPILLICDGADTTLPCRHSEKIFAAATGPKELWEVPNAFHTAALGYQPAEFQRRVLGFLATAAAAKPAR
jgi:alpha-beta hydrolase superfamily lysophospholipase